MNKYTRIGHWPTKKEYYPNMFSAVVNRNLARLTAKKGRFERVMPEEFDKIFEHAQQVETRYNRRFKNDKK